MWNFIWSHKCCMFFPQLHDNEWKQNESVIWYCHLARNRSWMQFGGNNNNNNSEIWEVRTVNSVFQLSWTIEVNFIRLSGTQNMSLTSKITYQNWLTWSLELWFHRKNFIFYNIENVMKQLTEVGNCFRVHCFSTVFCTLTL
jgi:hypothetical protein